MQFCIPKYKEMINFNYLTLRKKLIFLAIFATLAVGLLIFLSQYQFFSQNIYKRTLSENKKLVTLLTSKINTLYQMEKEPRVYDILKSFSVYDEILDISIFKNGFEVGFYNQSGTKFNFNPNQVQNQLVEENYVIYKESLEIKNNKIDVLVRISLDEMNQMKKKFFYGVGLILLVLVIISIPTIYFLVQTISKPINELSDLAKEITEKKDYSIQIHREGTDEISRLYQSINLMLKEINHQQQTIQEINQDLEKKIRDRIRELEEESQKSKLLAQELQNKQRIDEGILKFAEIVASNAYSNIERWGDNLLYHLVKFIQADVAALYITDETINKNIKLKLISSYAYDVKTLLKRAFEAGDGITGQAVKNKEVIYLTDLPDGFLKISTILGEANPSCVLIVPLIAENQVHGVLEIASFKRLSENEIHFVRKVAETTAFTLLVIKNRENIQKLLLEAQDKNERLEAQEQEMKKTIQALEEAQKEMTKKDIEMRGQLHAIDSTLETAEFNMNGHFIRVNQAFLNTVGYEENELISKHHKILTLSKDNSNFAFWERFWEELNKGIPQSGEFITYTKNGEEVWHFATYTPVKNAEGIPYKVIMLANNITDVKLQALDYEGQISAINKSTPSVQYDMKGNILKMNNLANLNFQPQPEWNHVMNTFFMDNEDDKEELFHKIWNEIRFGRAYTTKMKRKKGDNQFIWVQTTFYPILNLKDKPIKVLEFFTNITQQVEAEEKIKALMLEMQQANEALKAQEEELLQNMEELEATQDELKKIADELKISEDNLKKMNENLENLVKERTKELETALENLKNTQAQLIQSEKMASLGQLVAGIAHEINTPIGAVKASAENMTDVLPLIMHSYPEIIQKLNTQQIQLFNELTQKALNTQKNLTSKEERTKRKILIQKLEEHSIPDADEFGRKLIEIGIYENIEPYISLFQIPIGKEILNVIYQIGQLKVNLDNISIAAAKTKKIVFALKTHAYQKQDEKAVWVDVRESIDTILTLYHNQMKYGVEVTTHFEEVPKIPAYPDEIGQIWTNIIHNALQAMNYSGKLHVEVKPVEEGVQVAITDSGPGIPEDILPKIFDPFFTTKPQGEGTGMGLDITLKIIKKHNGSVHVDTQPGKTTFYVTLPLKNDLPI
jgi:PAS domain S-box-containing protein